MLYFFFVAHHNCHHYYYKWAFGALPRHLDRQPSWFSRRFFEHNGLLWKVIFFIFPHFCLVVRRRDSTAEKKGVTVNCRGGVDVTGSCKSEWERAEVQFQREFYKTEGGHLSLSKYSSGLRVFYRWQTPQIMTDLLTCVNICVCI